MNKVIEDQLKKVEFADLSKFNSESNSYFIKKRVDIKIEEGSCYLIHIKPSIKTNTLIATNWNGGSITTAQYMKVDISKKMSKMLKIVGVEFDPILNQDKSNFWSGWVSLDDIEVLQKL